MHDVLTFACVAGFAVLPLVVLSLRAIRPKRMPWWLGCLLVVFLGWALILATAMLSETPESGAGKVFALFLGWAYAVAWFIPWLLVYGVIQLFRRRLARRNA
ncbi:MAG: hypothetical protein RJA22_471 [Verrucomicrobiota bacterium]|jgi:cobalamin synthase